MRDRIAAACFLGSLVSITALGLLLASPGSDVQRAHARLARGQGVYDVGFLETGLDPVTVTVPVSSTVRWINWTSVTHSTVHRADAGQTAIWNSYAIAPNGGEFSHTFEHPGVYPYFDLYRADDRSYYGSVVVTGTVAVTPSPTATDEPTPTAEASETQATPTVEPTPATVSLTGKLIEPDPDDQCRHDARLERCHTGEIFRVRSDTQLTSLIGLDVKLHGVLTPCEGGGGSFVQLDSIEVNPGGCGTPPPSPPPTPTPEPKPNLAVSAPPVWSDEMPGFPASNAVDGDPATEWRSSRDASWIYLDLGHGEAVNQTFNELVLRWGEPFAVRYALYVYENDAWNGVYQTLVAGDGGVDQVSLPPIYARFVLLYLIESSQPGAGYALREWELYGRETVNQARGGAIVASSAQADHPAVHAIDGDYETYWASEPGDPNPWIRVHLPGSYVDWVRLTWMPARFPTVYTTVNYDGSREVPLTWYATEASFHELGLLTPIRTDAFLLYTRKLPDQSLHIELAELELYAPGAFSSVNGLRPQTRGAYRISDSWSMENRFGRWHDDTGEELHSEERDESSPQLPDDGKLLPHLPTIDQWQLEVAPPLSSGRPHPTGGASEPPFLVLEPTISQFSD